MSDRAYRVCFVTADEAEYLTRNGKNEIAKCCGHLWCFHDHGVRDDGSEWGFCNISGCDCVEETPPSSLDRARAAQEEALDLRLRRLDALRWACLGFGLCGLVWALTERLL